MRTGSATHDYDSIVVGAGPYGLSAAAHLIGRGLGVGVFGKGMSFWQHNVPDGVFLRSRPWAMHLSDPRHRYTFDRFARETGADISYPISRSTFIAYGLWFQDRAVPSVDPTFISSIGSSAGGFALQTADGRQVTSAAVVMAVGLACHAYRPTLYDHLPPRLVSHSSDHQDITRFAGKQVLVVGGGHSAVEYAALLHEAGATVDLVARRPIEWRSTDRDACAPATGRALLDRLPYAFYHMPQWAKDRYSRLYSAGVSDSLRERSLGKVALHERQSILAIDAKGDAAVATISDGKTLRANHVVLATGFRVDLDALTILEPSLRRAIRTDNGAPLLTPWFESSVRGLFFSGLTTVRAFGPMYRFVAGCGPAARRVASAIAGRRVVRSRSVMSLSWSTSAS
jgi:cation diffusion facilitator CzcD-associated flavoprotein CzcO